jgi:hypothetical protein
VGSGSVKRVGAAIGEGAVVGAELHAALTAVSRRFALKLNDATRNQTHMGVISFLTIVKAVIGPERQGPGFNQGLPARISRDLPRAKRTIEGRVGGSGQLHLRSIREGKHATNNR